MLGRDPCAVVSHRQNPLTALRLDADRYLRRRAFASALFDGVFDEVFRQPDQVIAITWDYGRRK